MELIFVKFTRKDKLFIYEFYNASGEKFIWETEDPTLRNEVYYNDLDYNDVVTLKVVSARRNGDHYMIEVKND